MPGSGLLRTKTIEQSIRDTDVPSTRLAKSLSSWDLTVLGVSVLVGTGIFTLTARTAGDMSGPSVSIAFVMAAIACVFAALCYAEFASTVPVAGSAYTFSYATFGELIAWIVGWDMILELAVAAAALSKSWSTYLADFIRAVSGSEISTSLGQPGDLVRFDWGALLVVLTVATLLVLGTKLSSRVNMVITVIKVGVVLLVIVVGARYISPDNYTPFIPPAEAGQAGTGMTQSLLSAITGAGSSTFGLYGLLAGASLVFFAFIGFDVVATTAEEARTPQTSIPRGILGALGIVTLLYVAASLVVSGMVPHGALATAAGTGERKTLATAFALHGADWAATLITTGALIGLTTVVMIMMLGQVRMLFAMSRDGLLPRPLAHTHPRTGTPVRATLVVGTVVALVATLFPADQIEDLVNIGTLFAFILVAAGVLILRRTRPELPRAFRVPAVPLIPILAILCCLWLMLNLSVLTWLRFLAWMAAGAVLYLAYSRRNSALAHQPPHSRDNTTIPSTPAE